VKLLREGKTFLERDPILRRIVGVIVEVLDPDRIILFGSRARGDYDEDSDYDILVLKDGVRPHERKKLQRMVRNALMEAGVYSFRDIDVVVQDSERFRDLSKSRYMLYYWAKDEGVVLYDKAGV